MSVNRNRILFVAALAFGCSANEAIEAGTSCEETCPVGAQKISAKEASGSCGANGSYSPEGAAEGGGSCVGTGECQVVCLYPTCGADQTLVISATEFRCEAGGNPCVADACSGHGRCRNENGAAQCVCDPGFIADGLQCVPGMLDDAGMGDAAAACACPETFACTAGACQNMAEGACGWRVPGPDVDTPMCRVLAGTYTQGCDAGTEACEASAQPNVNVELTQSFIIDRNEVTQRQYAAFLAANPATHIPRCPAGGEPSLWDAASRTVPDPWLDHPVTCVTAAEAEAFCAYAGKVLPTEAQWEAAARGNGLERAYPWGPTFDGTKAQCLTDWTAPHDPTTECLDSYVDHTCPGDNARFCLTTAPTLDGAGELTLPTGKATCGAHHMAGNVAELTADAYVAGHADCVNGCADRHPETTAADPRAVRGGSFSDAPGAITTWARAPLPAGETSDDVGFRCVRLLAD